jgi:hypothetical protein
LSQTFTHTSTFVVVTCYECGIEFGVPKYFNEQCHEKGEDKSFYCPNGHGQVYTKTEAQRLREQLANAKRDLKWESESRLRAQQDAEYFKKSRNAYTGKVTSLKNRAANGICPCCSRYFANLHRHMQSKHPEFTAEEPNA